MWRPILAVSLLIPLALVSGCANPYKDSYSGIKNARNLARYDDAESDLKIYSTNNFARDAAYLVSKSYWPIGQSAFQATAGMMSEQKLRDHARKIGAQAVLVNSRYSHTTRGAIPLNVPKQSTTYFSGSATAVGSGGFGRATGSGTSTTYYSETLMLPFSIDQYQVGVLYFAKVKHRLGLAVIRPTANVLRQVGTNAGMLVYAVVENTPAFYADFFAGDYILSINNNAIYSFRDYMAAVDRNEGKTITITFLREGKEITKSVRVRKVDGSAQPQKLSSFSKRSDRGTERDRTALKGNEKASDGSKAGDSNPQAKFARTKASEESPRRIQLGLYLKDLTIESIDRDTRRQLMRSRRNMRDAREMYSVTPQLVWTVPENAPGIKKIEGTLRIEMLDSGESIDIDNWTFQHVIQPGHSVVQRNRPLLFVDKPDIHKEWIYETNINRLGARFFPSKIVYEDGVEVEF